MYLTFTDVLDSLLEFVQAHDAAPPSTIRRAVIRAYDEVVHAHEWTFLRGTYRIHCHAAEDTGTVDYDHSTYTVTLTGGTWPSWAATASLYLDDVVCDVASRTDDTTLVLSSTANPGADVADGTFTIFPRWYSLPGDFLDMADPLGESLYQLGTKISWEEMVQQHRWVPTSGDLKYWALGPAPDSSGQAIFVYPALDEDVRLDIPYKKRSRDLRYTGQESAEYQGTVTVSGTAVTGSGTAFTSGMVGSILRVASSTTVPTGIEGRTPYAQEYLISSVTDATHLTISESGTAASGKAYRIADPIDLERYTWDALIQCAEKHIARMRNYKEYRQIEANYLDALSRAKAADATEQPRRVAWSPRRTYVRLADLA